ncbi:MAG: hypothetical protein WBE17_15605 [Anaerolineae bacterium]
MTGVITTNTPGMRSVAQRPLDIALAIPGNHNVHEWVEFTHTLGPEPQTLHPVKVYSENYGTMWGIGKYAMAYSGGTASYELFGDGRDGDLVVASGQTAYVDDVRTHVLGNAPAGQNTISVANTAGFAVGQDVLIIQIQANGPGTYEFGRIASVDPSSLTLGESLHNSYQGLGASILFDQTNYSGRAESFTFDDSCLNDNYVGNDATSSIRVLPGTTATLYEHCGYAGTAETFTYDDPDLGNNPIGNDRASSIRIGGGGKAQVLRVLNYRNVTVSGNLTVHAWDGYTGGILAFRAMGIAAIQAGGRIDVSENGYRGGQEENAPAWRGEGTGGPSTRGNSANGNGGGGGGDFNQNLTTVHFLSPPIPSVEMPQG